MASRSYTCNNSMVVVLILFPEKSKLLSKKWWQKYSTIPVYYFSTSAFLFSTYHWNKKKNYYLKILFFFLADRWHIVLQEICSLHLRADRKRVVDQVIHASGNLSRSHSAVNSSEEETSRLWLPETSGEDQKAENGTEGIQESSQATEIHQHR